MRKRITYVILVSIGLVGCANVDATLQPVPKSSEMENRSAKHESEHPPRENVAALPALLVLPLATGEDLAATGKTLDQLILTAVHEVKKYQVLGPDDLNAILGMEQLKDAMGCDEVSCAAEIGGALGAQYLVAGQLNYLGKEVALSMKLIDTQQPIVLERAFIRGSGNASALTNMVAAAIATIFKTSQLVVNNVQTPHVAPTKQYKEYQELFAELGRFMSKNEYTQLYERVKQSLHQGIEAPPGIDTIELLTYYQITACYMLKRFDCVHEKGSSFLTTWPQSQYVMSIQNYLDHISDEKFQQQELKATLEKRLIEIKSLLHMQKISDLQAAEMIAYAYMSAKQYGKAAVLFREYLTRVQDNNKFMDIVQAYVTVLELSGQFRNARNVLMQARNRDPRLFRLKGLHYHLRRLPK